MRLLVWHWGRRGAGPLYALNMARALQDDPSTEIFLSYSRQNYLLREFRNLRLDSLEVNTFRSGTQGLVRSIFLPRIRSEFRRFVSEKRIEVVYCPMWHPWNFAMVGCLRREGIPYALTIHDATRHEGDAGVLQRYVERKEQHAADAYIALSSHVKHEIDDRLHQPPFGTRLIPLPDFFPMQELQTEISCESRVKFLFIGRIRPYKGLEVLLDALAKLDETLWGKMQVTIAGEGDLGSLADKFCSLPNVTLKNYWHSDHEFQGTIASHDVMLLPYLEASQSGIIAAAFGLGKPVVAFPVGGLSEQITNGLNGVVTDSPTPQALAQAIQKIVINPTVLRDLRAGVITSADTRPSWHEAATSVTDLCREMLSSGSLLDNQGTS